MGLEKGQAYTQISASDSHTVLLRSDGMVVACGNNRYGECSIPALEVGVRFAEQAWQADIIVQLFTEVSTGGVLVVGRDLSGEQIVSLSVPVEDRALPVHRSIGKVLAPGSKRICIIAPDGSLVGPQLTWQNL